MPPHDCICIKESDGLEGNQAKHIFVRIYNKVEGSDKVLKGFKNDLSTISDSEFALSFYQATEDPTGSNCLSSKSKVK
ncbi:hypothetical protein RDI58_024266 [Solanum bulbocastanum]|uniref:Uncharacterized protein n=1 Tax=Solanum bulbocastanum TaxID=147425 RepID=A0AAN8Y357_SOLBU